MQERLRIYMLFSLALFLLFFCFSFVNAASSVEQEIQRLTHYAQEYEIGNINYAQFSVYLGSVQKSLDSALGAKESMSGSVLEATQLESALGKPTEKTEWVWVEKEEREMRLKEEIPAWRKLVFDGTKIQIRLNAWPHIYSSKENNVRYRLNTEIIFKRQEEKFNPQEAISSVKQLAEQYNSAPIDENAEVLAKESVLTEGKFRELIERSPDTCENSVLSFLGPEVQRREQKTLRTEITLYEGKNYEGMVVLESCSECEWHWVNINSYVNSRGRSYPGESGGQFPDKNEREEYKGLTDLQFQEEIKTTIDRMRKAIEERKSIVPYENKLRALNDAWNDISNNVQEEIEQQFREKRESLPETEMQNYDWKAEEEARRNLEQSMRKLRYEKRLQFYFALFSTYPQKEHFIEEQNFERRLVETSKTFTSEMCSNQKDDNEDGEIDCEDSQCSGNWCGSTEINLTNEGKEYRVQRNLYCIKKTCQLKPDANVIRSNEMQQSEDRLECQKHKSITCSGIVLFKGKDTNGCPLQPICIEKKYSCSADSECVQPRCGTSACVEGTCKVTGLEVCKDKSCTDGEQRTEQCASGESLVVEFCSDGSWLPTHLACENTKSADQEQKTEENKNNIPQCNVKEDCSENEVCSNTLCVPLPEIRAPEIQIPNQEKVQLPQDSSGKDTPAQSPVENALPSEESASLPASTESFPENAITGAIIFSWRSFGKVIGLAFDEPEKNDSSGQESQFPVDSNISQEKNVGNNSSDKNPDLETTNNTNEQNYTRPQNSEQNSSQNNELSEQEGDDLFEQKNNENNTEEQKEELHTFEEQTGVFQVGGSCRKSQGRQEGNIYFGGWGTPFEKIEPLKQQYYQRGEEWCNREYENILKQRKEFEASFNEQFASWFFEDYLANAADEWESHVSGIFDLYWRDVEISRQLSERLDCLHLESLPPHTLLNFTYTTEYGKIEFWEEVKHTSIAPEDEAVDIISPYMRLFIFPPREFITHELQESMKNREFPGSPEEKEERQNEGGLTEEEKIRIREDSSFMKKLNKATAPYEGQLDASVQLVDYSTQKVIFNLYAQVNEEDIIKLQPILPEEQPARDVTIQIDFEKIYALMDFVQRKVEGGQMESPPWDKKPRKITESVQDMYNGIKIWFKVQNIINDAKIDPEENEREVKSLFKTIIWKMMTERQDSHGPEGMEDGERFDNQD